MSMRRCAANRIESLEVELSAGGRPYLLVFGRKERKNVWLTYLIRS
jgi:hypothetical protein